MTTLMRFQARSGQVITIPVTNQRHTERQCDGETHIEWSVDVDVPRWIALLAERMMPVAPEHPAERVSRDLAALASGNAGAAAAFAETYDIPFERVREWRDEPTLSARLLAVSDWLDDLGI